MLNRRTELLSRTELVWLGLGLAVLGVFTPENLSIGDSALSRVLFYNGVGLLLVSVSIALFGWATTTVAPGIVRLRERD